MIRKVFTATSRRSRGLVRWSVAGISLIVMAGAAGAMLCNAFGQSLWYERESWRAPPTPKPDTTWVSTSARIDRIGITHYRFNWNASSFRAPSIRHSRIPRSRFVRQRDSANGHHWGVGAVDHGWQFLRFGLLRWTESLGDDQSWYS